MSAARDLLDRLAEIGATVEAAGDRLILRAGAATVPAALVARLRQAKAEVLTTLADARGAAEPPPAQVKPDRTPWTPEDWRAYYSKRVEIRQRLDTRPRPRADAERLAWGELQNEWHMRYGESTPPRQCAGCGEPIGGREALALADGCRVHRDDGLQCLIAYGRRWRAAATRALTAMGLALPPGEGMP